MWIVPSGSYLFRRNFTFFCNENKKISKSRSFSNLVLPNYQLPVGHSIHWANNTIQWKSTHFKYSYYRIDLSTFWIQKKEINSNKKIFHHIKSSTYEQKNIHKRERTTTCEQNNIFAIIILVTVIDNDKHSTRNTV